MRRATEEKTGIFYFYCNLISEITTDQTLE